MKFQESSFNGLKVTVGTKSVTHAPTNGRSKSNMPHQLFQSWGHNYRTAYLRLCFHIYIVYSMQKNMFLLTQLIVFFQT